MIYGLSSWEKLDRFQPRLFANGNIVVLQRQKITTSQESFVLGALALALSAGSFFFPYILGETPWSLESLKPTDLFQATGALFGAILIAKSKEGMRIRNEHGGVHPEDTLLVLDANKKTFFRQKGTTEEVIAPLQNISLEIHAQRGNKYIEYRIFAIYPEGKTFLIKTTTQKSAETILQKIKDHLQLS